MLHQSSLWPRFVPCRCCVWHSYLLIAVSPPSLPFLSPSAPMILHTQGNLHIWRLQCWLQRGAAASPSKRVASVMPYVTCRAQIDPKSSNFLRTSYVDGPLRGMTRTSHWPLSLSSDRNFRNDDDEGESRWTTTGRKGVALLLMITWNINFTW